MGKFQTWDDFEKELKYTSEEDEAMRLEMEIIEATIEARKKSNLTQRELSERCGIRQPNIAKIENFKRSPQVDTLMKMLLAMGYTLRVVPLEKK